jgi:hypothetical protein
MNLRSHLLYGAAILAALVLFAWAERRAGAAEARAHATADSLAQITASLRLKADSALAHQHRDSLADAQFLRAQAGQQVALQAQKTAQEALRASIERRLADSASLRAAFDSLEALHQAREDSLTVQRERAIARFTGAAFQRDSLAELLRAAQRQSQGLSSALAQASRTPLWKRCGPGGGVGVALSGGVSGFVGLVCKI